MKKLLLICLLFGCNFKQGQPLKSTNKVDTITNNTDNEIENHIYGKCLTCVDTVLVNDEIIIKSTLSDRQFLEQARQSGKKGIVEGVLKNRSDSTITITQNKTWVTNDTIFHKLKVKVVNGSPDYSTFEFEVSLKVDVDNRNYYGTVDTIFPYVNKLIIKK